MKRKQIMITPDLEYQVDQLVKNGKVDSFSSAVREALVEYISEPLSNRRRKNTRKMTRQKTGIDTLLEMVKKAERSKNGGPADLSTNDDYLYGPESDI